MKRPLTLIALLMMFLSLFGCAGEVRQPAVAGAFYPADPAVLCGAVDGYIDAAPKLPVPGELVALIVPHAGYEYSGGVAGWGFRQIKDAGYDTVILLGPSHYHPLRGASVYTGDAFLTPLGEARVDTMLARTFLDEKAGVVYEPGAHEKEHSLEVEVPFLQRSLGKFKIVPIAVGSPDKPMLDSLATSISSAINARPGKTLLVVSTDWSHYHDYDTAVAMDGLGIETVEDLSSFELGLRAQTGAIELCGIYPAMLAMDVAGRLGADTVKVFRYANSGDVTGDRSRVVGYAAIGIYRSGADRAGLTPAQRAELLSIARDTLDSYIATGKAPKAAPADRALLSRRGAFVTLKKGGELRGCIGNFFSDGTLADTVREMAVCAASRDNRFTPVTKGELKDISVEVSVLSPLRKIASIDEIETGRHGLYIVKGRNTGVLLPQVAVEQGWDRSTFVRQTCLKAGLAPDAWMQGADLYVFTAEVFGEDR